MLFCPVLRPHYSARSKRFRSRSCGPSKDVRPTKKILKSETTSSPGSSCFPIWRRHIGKREDEAVLSLAQFCVLERDCMDRVRPLLSIRGMLLRYSLEPSLIDVCLLQRAWL